MKINFIIPFTSLTGGIKVVFEYANRLSQNGHDVICYVPAKAYKFNGNFFKMVKASIGNTIVRGNKVDWLEENVCIKLVPIINNYFIRDADVVVATAWPTAYDVYKLDEKKGEKFYFIQHYEIWSGPEELVDNSYKLPMKRIVIAKWLEELLKDKFNVDVCGIVNNGINLDEFYNCNKVYNNKEIRILLLNHSVEMKGTADGVKVFERVAEKYTNVKLVMFGMHGGELVPEYAEFHENPTKEKLREIYSTCDIYIFPSWSEGWGLTVAEAMACKCAVVGNNVGCLMDIGIHRETAMISEAHDIECMTKNVIELIENSNLLKYISNNGYEKVKMLDWKNSVDNFYNIIKNTYNI